MSDSYASQARIGRAGAADETIGCGLLVTPRHIVTCAHVVASALGTEDTTTAEAPADLPLLTPPFRTTSQVIRWLPMREVGEEEKKAPEDIAVLELAAEVPPAAEPASLLGLEPDDYINLSVHCFGFPAGIEEGTHRPGICRGENTLGWVQTDIERGLVEKGFSGTGAWDPNQGAAVGLVVAARDPEPHTGDQSAYLIPARTLFAAWPELDRTWRPRNPYKGLAAFGAGDRADFFGRTDLIPRLADRVQGERLTTLIGPSGSGKSSLIGAGLVPVLADRSGWRCLITRPGTDPFDELAGRLIAREDLTLAQRTDERERLSVLLADLPAGPVRVLREYLADSPGTALLLVVDQFEELFTNVQSAAPHKEGVAKAPLPPGEGLGRGKQRAKIGAFCDPLDKAQGFVAALEALSGSDLPVHLLLAIRADFMGRAMEGPTAPFVQPPRQFQVGPLEGGALRAAVEGPAQALGVRFAAGLVETILAEVADQPGRLPLLQFALTRLWEEQRSRSIDAAALKRIGGVRRALSGYADGVIDKLSEAERTRARRILVQLVRPSQREDETATRQVASFRSIPEQDQDLLPKLARGRLIVTSHGPGDEPVAEIAHEALIREWEQLKTWVAEDRSFRLWQEGLRNRMAEWEAHTRHPGYLLTGPPLAEAEGRLAARPEDLSKDDKNYIRVSRHGSFRLWQEGLRSRMAEWEAHAKHPGFLLTGLPLAEAEGWLAARPLHLSKDDSDYIRAGRHHAQRRKHVVRGTVAAVILILAAFGSTAWWQGQRANEAREEAERLVEFITFDLRRKLEPLGKLELLGDVQQRVDAYYERLGVLEDNPDVMRWRAVNFFDSGDLQVSLGDLAAAEQLYAKGARILERLADDDPNNTGWQRDLSVSLNKVGDIKAQQGDLAGALSAYEAGKVIAERLAGADPSNAGWQLDLAVSLWKLSGKGLAEPEAAHGYLRQALEILEVLDAAGKLHGGH